MVRKNIKFFIATALTAVLITCSGCGLNAVESARTAAAAQTGTASNGPSYEKPAQITMMVDGTLVTLENGRDEFEARWEALTGIDLVIIQPEHDVYYEEVTKAFESGDLPDVILLSSSYYTIYAAENLLADI